MKFGYAIVYVDSVADTLKFYKEAFGFETRFLHESGQYGELETGNTALAFASHSLGEINLGGRYQKTNLSTPPLGIELAFVSEDVDKAYAKAVSAGAVSITAPSKKPWGQVVASGQTVSANHCVNSDRQFRWRSIAGRLRSSVGHTRP